jgi:hypothetical protein
MIVIYLNSTLEGDASFERNENKQVNVAVTLYNSERIKLFFFFSFGQVLFKILIVMTFLFIYRKYRGNTSTRPYMPFFKSFPIPQSAHRSTLYTREIQKEVKNKKMCRTNN